MSKAALNMFTKCLSVELKRHKVAVASIHPGTVDTDLSKPYQGNVRKDKLFTPRQSVAYILKVVNSISLDDTGSFFAYDGTKIDF